MLPLRIDFKRQAYNLAVILRINYHKLLIFHLFVTENTVAYIPKKAPPKGEA